MKRAVLSELLTKDQIKAVEQILKDVKEEVKYKKLREYLQGLRDQLEKKGVVPEYLAYAIEYQQTRKQNET